MKFSPNLGNDLFVGQLQALALSIVGFDCEEEMLNNRVEEQWKLNNEPSMLMRSFLGVPALNSSLFESISSRATL